MVRWHLVVLFLSESYLYSCCRLRLPISDTVTQELVNLKTFWIDKKIFLYKSVTRFCFKFMALVLSHVFQNYVNKFKFLSHFKSTVLLGRLEVKSFLKTGK